MTTLTLRYLRGDFLVTGPDVEPIKFKTRREARDWCDEHYPGSPLKEIGADGVRRTVRAPSRKAEWDRYR
jgi:hypothetical protein